MVIGNKKPKKVGFQAILLSTYWLFKPLNYHIKIIKITLFLSKISV